MTDLFNYPEQFKNTMSELPDEYLGKTPNGFKRMRESMGSVSVGNIDIKWKGRLVQLPVFRISIKHLRYNLFNTRIKPHLLQNIAENGYEQDHFSKNVDKDAISTQKMINGFLRKNHDRKDALNYFKNPKNDVVIQEALIATPDGRVLNGNQRLCVFRQLYYSNMEKYTKLQQAYVAFLPDNGTPGDERELEASFQETKLAAVPFDWIQSGLWAIEEMKKGKSSQQIGRTLGLSEQEAKFEIQRIGLAKEFLTYISKTDYWQELREMNLKQAFKTLAQQMNKEKVREKRENMKLIAFRFMSETDSVKDTGKSVHLLIGDLAKNIDKFEISDDETTEEDETTEDNGLDDLLAPRKKKKESKTNKEKINLKEIKPSDLTRKISDTEDIRKKKHAAKNEKTFGLRQMKSSVTSFDNIIDNWDKIDKKGLKTEVNKAVKKLLEIQERLNK